METIPNLPLVDIGNMTRRSYLGLCRDAVLKYRDLMEQRTGVNLGKVKVRDMRWDYADELKRIMISPLIEAAKSLNPIRIIWETYISACGLTIAPFLSLRALKKSRGPDRHSAHYHSQGKICINTHRSSRASWYPNAVERLAVHELGHHLWRTLGKEDSEDNERKSTIKEGFSVYHEISFFDAYPIVRKPAYHEISTRKKYADGLLRILNFLDAHGEEVLLEIPRRWKELDDTTPVIPIRESPSVKRIFGYPKAVESWVNDIK